MKYLKKSLLTVLTVFTLFMVGTHGMEAKALAPAPPATCFSATYLTTDMKSVGIDVAYKGARWIEVELCNANQAHLQTYIGSFYASFDGLKKNQLYYFRIRGCNGSYSSPEPYTEWSAFRAFTTVKPTAKLTSKRSRTVSIKVPKTAGVKKYKIYMSTNRNKINKKIKVIKPGKKFTISKFKGKAFKYYQNYYYKAVPVLKKPAAAIDYPTIGYFYIRRIY